MAGKTLGIGVFGSKDQLLISPIENGGWTVATVNGSQGSMPRVIGAYTDTADMLNALINALETKRDIEPHGHP